MHSWIIGYGLILHIEGTWWTQMTMITMFRTIAINLMHFKPFYFLIMIPSYTM
jgi:hypothetical protein